MSDVKRVEIDHKGLPFFDEGGVYVFYEDYQKLAAENAALKDFALSLCFPDGTSQVQVQDLPLIPATDAHLNSVRAEGVDMLADSHQRIVDTLNGDSLFADGERRHAAIAAAAVHFAAKLRAGKDGE